MTLHLELLIVEVDAGKLALEVVAVGNEFECLDFDFAGRLNLLALLGLQTVNDSFVFH